MKIPLVRCWTKGAFKKVTAKVWTEVGVSAPLSFDPWFGFLTFCPHYQCHLCLAGLDIDWLEGDAEVMSCPVYSLVGLSRIGINVLVIQKLSLEQMAKMTR